MNRIRYSNPKAMLALAALSGTALSGCATNDSFLNPSVTGRWEHTPTRVPILEHLAAIEDPEDQWVEISEITSDDLRVQNDVYRVGPGDILTLTIWDLVVVNQPELLPRQVGPNGYIEIPQVGRVFVSGMTEKEVARSIADAMVNILSDPLVSVNVEQRRELSFHLMGNVAAPGSYTIPGSDYRILEGLVSAGGVPQFINELYVIRQVPLDPEASTLMPEPVAPEPSDPLLDDPENNPDRDPGESLLDVIDDLSAPGMVSGSRGSLIAPPSSDDREPMIDLIDSPTEARNPSAGSSVNAARTAEMDRANARWRFVDGEWRRAVVPFTGGREIAREDSMVPTDQRGQLFTQRVIRVPIKPLLAGDARYNIVIRPGDVINVPPNPAGNVYIDGQVNGPGVYSLPVVSRLTLTRAITSAGGLNGLAVPERIDLTRLVGKNEQATIMLNLRAIEEGTQPDVYIKPDDRINVGTNFWATPLAVFRSGFRTNYGFGFLLDRNFGNDVFGAPPTNNRF